MSVNGIHFISKYRLPTHSFQDILVACPNVQKLTLGKCDNLDDELMFNILQCQSLQKCEELCLCDAPGLTQESVRAILMSLDKYAICFLFILEEKS